MVELTTGRGRRDGREAHVEEEAANNLKNLCELVGRESKRGFEGVPSEGRRRMSPPYGGGHRGKKESFGGASGGTRGGAGGQGVLCHSRGRGGYRRGGRDKVVAVSLQ